MPLQIDGYVLLLPMNDAIPWPGGQLVVADDVVAVPHAAGDAPAAPSAGVVAGSVFMTGSRALVSSGLNKSGMLLLSGAPYQLRPAADELLQQHSNVTALRAIGR